MDAVDAAKPTPTPWVAVGPYIVHTGAGFGAVCILAEPECKSTRDIQEFDPFISEREEEAEANAALIVAAVNSYAAMRDALERALASFEGCECDCRTAQYIDDSTERIQCLICEIKAALALAGKGA